MKSQSATGLLIIHDKDFLWLSALLELSLSSHKRIGLIFGQKVLRKRWKPKLSVALVIRINPAYSLKNLFCTKVSSQPIEKKIKHFKMHIPSKLCQICFLSAFILLIFLSILKQLDQKSSSSLLSTKILRHKIISFNSHEI